MTTFGEYVHQRFGVLSAGKHAPDEGAACILEAASAWRGVDWTDNPAMLGLPDIRPINDADWSSDGARTEAMVRLYALTEDWAVWSDERCERFVERVILRTAREVLPLALRAMGKDNLAERLERAETLEDAVEAAEDAYMAKDLPPQLNLSMEFAAHISFEDAEKALAAAALAVFYAASAVVEVSPDATDELLQTAVTIWIEAAA